MSILFACSNTGPLDQPAAPPDPWPGVVVVETAAEIEASLRDEEEEESNGPEVEASEPNPEASE